MKFDGARECEGRGTRARAQESLGAHEHERQRERERHGMRMREMDTRARDGAHEHGRQCKRVGAKSTRDGMRGEGEREHERRVHSECAGRL